MVPVTRPGSWMAARPVPSGAADPEGKLAGEPVCAGADDDAADVVAAGAAAVVVLDEHPHAASGIKAVMIAGTISLIFGMSSILP